MRRIANWSMARAKSAAPAMSSRSLGFRFLSSTPPPNRVISGSAAGIADVTGEDDEDDDPVYSSHLLGSSVVKPVIPDVLQPGVVVYDGVCHLCHRGVKWIIKVDKYRHIKFCCLQSKTAESYLRVSGLDREDVMRRFLFVEGPGLYHQGSTAALRVLSYLPFPYSALSSLMIIPTPLRDAAYDYVAKRRYNWFGKTADCLVLKEKELLERFVDRVELMGRPDGD